MLVGLPPWEFAREEDPRYRMVVRGGLARMLESWNRPISPLAVDLLQRMLRENPKERLSLCEVKDHPWVTSSFDEGSVAARHHHHHHQYDFTTGDEEWRK
jgi:serine/threonine protein kinase